MVSMINVWLVTAEVATLTEINFSIITSEDLVYTQQCGEEQLEPQHQHALHRRQRRPNGYVVDVVAGSNDPLAGFFDRLGIVPPEQRSEKKPKKEKDGKKKKKRKPNSSLRSTGRPKSTDKRLAERIVPILR
ncbi:hypothetical protein LTR56_001105 [Elasticomyces elasticus]|nr:hypothetical protein LTR56_001105 [Elasticomyces elasticus]KAK3663506.1 hypothetical protein LTR22_005677 [Elasticomyces elasticus]KAK4927108.1 hypothetical protein LTR49_006024 [Elasticomyces elasticus]KAK5769027.1 hypothetical protein LTS12_000740 [Elasticomyces elasticus]